MVMAGLARMNMLKRRDEECQQQHQADLYRGRATHRYQSIARTKPTFRCETIRIELVAWRTIVRFFAVAFLLMVGIEVIACDLLPSPACELSDYSGKSSPIVIPVRTSVFAAAITWLSPPPSRCSRPSGSSIPLLSRRP